MRRFLLAAFLLAGLAPLAGPARAQDKVTYRDRKTGKDVELTGTIEDEGPGGIKIKVRTEAQTVPALEVRRVLYKSPKVEAFEFRQYLGKQDRAAEAGTTPARRKVLLEEALKGYDDMIGKLVGEARPHRYILFKRAEVLAQQAQTDPTQADAAIKALTEYKTNHSTGWEVVPALKLLARLHEERGEGKAAAQAYADLASLPDAPPALKQQSDILVAKLLLREGQYADAGKRLQALQRVLSQEDPQRAYIDVYLAQSELAQGNLGAVEKQLKEAIRQSSDPALQGLAWNCLGDYYLARRQPEEAFWSFLRVDVMYSQDREEHARALFHLATLFDQVKKDPVRARQCAERLGGKQFEGTVFQKKAGQNRK